MEENYYFQDTMIDGQDVTIEWHAGSLQQPEYRSSGEVVRQHNLLKSRELLSECDACVLIYDCADRWQFRDIARLWASVQDDEELARGRAYSNVWVAHNKIDPDEKGWPVSLREGQQWSSSIGATFVPMSTRTGVGCTQELGVGIARQVWDPMRLTYTIPGMPTSKRARCLPQVTIGSIRPIFAGGRSLIERVCPVARTVVCSVWLIQCVVQSLLHCAEGVVYRRRGQSIYSCRRHYAPMPMDFLLSDGKLVSIRWQTDSIFAHLRSPFNRSKNIEDARVTALVPNVDACILLYSVTDRPGFLALVESWERRRLAHDRSAAQGAFCDHLWVVANKKDSPDGAKAVSTAEGEQWANEIGAIFRETSAMNGECTNSLVDEIVSAVLCDDGKRDTK